MKKMKKLKEWYDISMCFIFGVLTIACLCKSKIDYATLALIVFFNYANNIKYRKWLK